MNEPTAILKNKKIVEYEAAVLGATAGGFFFDAGTRVKNCRHQTCGFREPPYRDCWLMQYEANDPNLYKDDTKNWNYHTKKGCQFKWCVVEHGKAPKVIPKTKLAKCKRTYFTAYTNKQLADPTTNVELVAIKLDIGVFNDYPCNAFAVYDLLNDKWHNEKWWTITPKGHLAPHAYRHPNVPPQQVQGIDAVIAKLKSTL
jgi:hypothetical protein